MERAFPQSIEAERAALRAALVFDSHSCDLSLSSACLRVEGGCGIVSSGGHEDVDELEERYRSRHPPVVVSFIHGTVDVAGLQVGGAALFLRLASPDTAAIVQACGAGSCDGQARGAEAGDPDYFPLDALVATSRRGDH
ncbi:hypothetical protein HK405_010280, partial [Cladochytrium tenue]